MKIVAIEHLRCAEFDGLTYYACDEALTNYEIDKLIDDAQVEYLAALARLETVLDLPPMPNTNLISVQKDDGMDNVTIGEARAQYNEWQKKWNEKVSVLNNDENRFEYYILKRGFKTIYKAHDTMKTLDWGHAHGKHLKYLDDK